MLRIVPFKGRGRGWQVGAIPLTVRYIMDESATIF
jgi:hypothetical protein